MTWRTPSVVCRSRRYGLRTGTCFGRRTSSIARRGWEHCGGGPVAHRGSIVVPEIGRAAGVARGACKVLVRVSGVAAQLDAGHARAQQAHDGGLLYLRGAGRWLGEHLCGRHVSKVVGGLAGSRTVARQGVHGGGGDRAIGGGDASLDVRLSGGRFVQKKREIVPQFRSKAVSRRFALDERSASMANGSLLGDALHDVRFGGARASSQTAGRGVGMVVVGKSVDFTFAENVAQNVVRGDCSWGGEQRLGGGPFEPIRLSHHGLGVVRARLCRLEGGGAPQGRQRRGECVLRGYVELPGLQALTCLPDYL